MTATTYTFQCPCCGEIVTDNYRQAYVIITPKSGQYPRTYEICAECLQDLYDLLDGRIEQRIKQAEDERIPVSLWGHHE